MRNNIYDYDTMSAAKKIVEAMKKNNYSSWLNWLLGIKFDIISDEEENDNNAGLDDNEKQEL